jgi:hypothetical protein
MRERPLTNRPADAILPTEGIFITEPKSIFGV